MKLWRFLRAWHDALYATFTAAFVFLLSVKKRFLWSSSVLVLIRWYTYLSFSREKLPLETPSEERILHAFTLATHAPRHEVIY